MNKKGFTLVELLIVIVLMGIIAGMTVPAFIGMGRGAEMRGVVRSLCSTISLTRQWAITHRETAGVIIETNMFFAFRGDANSLVSQADILNGSVNAIGKVVADLTQYFIASTGETGYQLANYRVYKNGSPLSVQRHAVFDNLSDPVVFDGIIFKIGAGNTLVFQSAGGLEQVMHAEFPIEIRDVRKPDIVVKKIVVSWLTGAVKVQDGR